MSSPHVVISKGLEGIYVAESGLSFIDTEHGKLYYAGYDIMDLVEKSCYEEVCYLLLNKRLPTKSEYESFMERFRESRVLSPEQVEVIKLVARGAEMINSLAAYLLLAYRFEMGGLMSRGEERMNEAITLISQAAPAVAAIHRVRAGQSYIEPRKDLSHAANFLYMLTGKEPDQNDAKAIDTIFILHAEHGIPASTFSALVTASTLSDLSSSVVSGLLSLKGPLHGGAAEAVNKQLREIGDPSRVEEWLRDSLEKKRRIMGMGHRVYKIYDPRAMIVKEMARSAAERKGGEVRTMYEIAERLESEALKQLAQRGIFPNLDFWTPIVYTSVGIPLECYTPLFAASRILGWTAHILEYWADNRLIRPSHHYVGEKDKKFVPLDSR